MSLLLLFSSEEENARPADTDTPYFTDDDTEDRYFTDDAMLNPYFYGSL